MMVALATCVSWGRKRRYRTATSTRLLATTMLVMMIAIVHVDANRCHRVLRSPASVVVAVGLIVLRVVPIASSAHGAAGGDERQRPNPEGNC